MVSFAALKDAASASDLGVGTFDEGAEAFTPENRLPEICDVPDEDGNVEVVGVGDDIICLKMFEVADGDPVLLAWVVVWKTD
jgi:hypothetical protein